MLSRFATAAILATQCACSDTTGIAQVDRARDAVQAEVGTTPAMRRLGDTAMGAARQAERAGETGNARQMGGAIANGTVDVLCAGSDASADAASALATTSARTLPGEAVVGQAVDAVRGAAARLPTVNPCAKTR